MTTAEVSAFSDLGLHLVYQRLADRLASDWRRGAPGLLSHVFDLALIRREAEIRSLALTPINLGAQEPLHGFPCVDVNGDLLLAG